MTTTVAIIGAGGIGGAHSAAYQALPETRVTAVVDIRPEQAQKIAAVHGAKAYFSVDDFLKHEKSDMADICVPTFLHPEMAIACAKAWDACALRKTDGAGPGTGAGHGGGCQAE